MEYASEITNFMFRHVRRLLSDFPFLLKVYELIMASLCINELLKYSEYTIPRWLWIVYCIDASTYFVIFFSIALTHVFEQPRRMPEFAYFVVGVVLHLIGGLAGIIRSFQEEPVEVITEEARAKIGSRSELKIGLFILANLLVLICETGYMYAVDFYGLRPPTRRSTRAASF